MTPKEILHENRDSAISSIKYIYKVWKMEEIIAVMKRLLIFAENRPEYMAKVEVSKRKKSDIKVLIQKMYISEKGRTTHKSVRDIYENYELTNNVKFDYSNKEYINR